LRVGALAVRLPMNVRIPGVHSPARVLVVDDEEPNRRVLGRLLERLGHTVRTEPNGAAALSALEAESFDLLTLDLEMPQVSGLDVLERLRMLGKLSHMPTIVISGVAEVAAVAQCIELGADDFIHKPFEPRIVEARVRASLAKKRLHDYEQAYLRMVEEEEARSERLILSMLPASVARRLKNGEAPIADHVTDASVLFADVVGFTTRAAAMDPRDLVALLDGIFSTGDELVAKHGLEKIKTIGDAYMVVGGIPEPLPQHAELVARFALELVATVRRRFAVELRVGIHAGPVVAGVIGSRRPTYDVWGHTVNFASRMESHGVPGRVHVSADFRDRVAGAFSCEGRGEVAIKGHGTVVTYLLCD
jgi:adenylate cyclase